MPRTRAVLAATSLATAAALLVAGCADDEPPTATPRPGTSASAKPSSPSPTAKAIVVAPERPQALDDDGPAGAEAAAVYFLELDDYIMKTGDTAEWEAMSHKSCEYCANRLRQAREIAAKGYDWESKPTTASVTHLYEQDQATGIWPVDVKVAQGAVTLTDMTDAVIYEEKPVQLHLAVEVGRQDGAWVMIGAAQIKEK
ncbi:DUF6318 family protein [Isoptericola sp. NPDC055881]